MLKLTRRLSGCEDKNCPAVDQTSQPGMLAVTGTKLGFRDRLRTRRIRSHGEVTSLVPEERLHEAARALGYIRP